MKTEFERLPGHSKFRYDPNADVRICECGAEAHAALSLDGESRLWMCTSTDAAWRRHEALAALDATRQEGQAMKTFLAWGREYTGEEMCSRRTGEGPEDGFTLYLLANGERIAVPWGCSDASWVADADGREED